MIFNGKTDDTNFMPYLQTKPFHRQQVYHITILKNNITRHETFVYDKDVQRKRFMIITTKRKNMSDILKCESNDDNLFDWKGIVHCEYDQKFNEEFLKHFRYAKKKEALGMNKQNLMLHPNITPDSILIFICSFLVKHKITLIFQPQFNLRIWNL